MTSKILLVENDEPTCKMLQQQLVQHGYNVVSAIDGGDKGILMAVTEAPDLIMIATDLPVIDGWQTIKILKNSTVTQNIPVIALMALTSETEWGKVTESGCDDYELKPIDLTSVLNKIKALLSPTGVSTVSTKLSGSTSQLVDSYQPIPYPVKESSGSKQLNQLAKAAAQTAASQSMVVYIDDSPADSRTLAAIIKGAGYGYDNISEPLEAIPTLLELKPSLIFLDLVMPLTNGYEVCAQIRRTSIFRKTPIIIVTNNNGIIDRVRARIVGASGFFSKPVHEKRVIKVLHKHLSASNSNISKGASPSRFSSFI
ncbi:response regulator transcription factor [Leptolyngbya sp. Heron Island J]|uniref:response regulator transcription factor n=1 Tax=Leptolyngbya sp. Heron Island J TaxID=1385935 RepID=UPI0009DD8DEC|nr:response regulator [Leptolyngbya sp. Heron Island J]